MAGSRFADGGRHATRAELVFFHVERVLAGRALRDFVQQTITVGDGVGRAGEHAPRHRAVHLGQAQREQNGLAQRGAMQRVARADFCFRVYQPGRADHVDVDDFAAVAHGQVDGLVELALQPAQAGLRDFLDAFGVARQCLCYRHARACRVPFGALVIRHEAGCAQRVQITESSGLGQSGTRCQVRQAHGPVAGNQRVQQLHGLVDRCNDVAAIKTHAKPIYTIGGVTRVIPAPDPGLRGRCLACRAAGG